MGREGFVAVSAPTPGSVPTPPSPGGPGGRGPAVFLDRDGTLTARPVRGTYVTAPGDLRLADGAAGSLVRLNNLGLPAVVVTNQRWISCPNGSVQAYLRVHERLCLLLAEQGAHLDGHYYCPHPRWSCGCRKPAAGMLFAAARSGDYDLISSVLIGDSGSDAWAARTAGMAVVGIDGPDWDYACGPEPTRMASDLPAAVDAALGLLGGHQ